MKFKESDAEKFHFRKSTFKKDSAHSVAQSPSLTGSILRLNPIGIIGNLGGYYKKERKLFDFEYNQNLAYALIKLVGEDFLTQDLHVEKENHLDFALFVLRTQKERIESLILAKNKLEAMNILEELQKAYAIAINNTHSSL